MQGYPIEGTACSPWRFEIPPEIIDPVLLQDETKPKLTLSKGRTIRYLRGGLDNFSVHEFFFIPQLLARIFFSAISKELDSVPKYHIHEPTRPRSSVGRALG